MPQADAVSATASSCRGRETATAREPWSCRLACSVVLARMRHLMLVELLSTSPASTSSCIRPSPNPVGALPGVLALPVSAHSLSLSIGTLGLSFLLGTPDPPEPSLAAVPLKDIGNQPVRLLYAHAPLLMLLPRLPCKIKPKSPLGW